MTAGDREPVTETRGGENPGDWVTVQLSPGEHVYDKDGKLLFVVPSEDGGE
jgi:hypothetical protein